MGALQFGDFPLSEERWSVYYIDLRLLLSFPDAFRRVGEIFVQIAKNIVNPDMFLRIAGIPTAGIPYVSILAFFLSKPFLYVRKETETYGRLRRVEGILYPGDKVLLVDDLIASGESLLAAASAIKFEGGIVNDALVLIDRQEGGEKALAKADIKLHSFLTISEIAQILNTMDMINEEQFKRLLSQVKS